MMSAMSARGRPKTATWNMPEDWKAHVVDEMRRRKITRQQLAVAVGLTPGMITRMLTPVAQRGVRSSSYAPAVAEYLGIPLPGTPTDHELDELINDMREIRMASPAAFAEQFAAIVELRDSLRRVIRRARHPKK